MEWLFGWKCRCCFIRRGWGTIRRVHVDAFGGGGLSRRFAGRSGDIVVIRRSRCSVVLFFLPLVVVASFVRFLIVDCP